MSELDGKEGFLTIIDGDRERFTLRAVKAGTDVRGYELAGYILVPTKSKTNIEEK